MQSLEGTLSSGFAAFYREMAQKIHQWVDPLSTEQIWTHPYPYGNSVGHLLLHLTGNLNYYIGARIAETGYVRDRELEFTDSMAHPKEELLRNLDDTIALVIETIDRQSADDWQVAYSAKGTDEQNRFGIVLRCAAHLHHHLGQIIYLSKEIARQHKPAHASA